MSIGIGVTKAVLKIACGLSAPGIIIQEGFNALVDEAAEFYGNSKNEMSNRIAAIIRKETKKKRLSELNIPSNRQDYVVNEVQRILDEIPITIDTIVQSNQDTSVLTDALVNQYMKKTSYAVEEANHIKKMLAAILEQLINYLAVDTSFLFNGILTMQISINKLRAEIAEMKRLYSLQNSNPYPTFISERPYDMADVFIGRESIVNEIAEHLKMKSPLTIHGIGGVGKTEIAKAVIKKVEHSPCKEFGITRIAWVNYNNKSIHFSIAKSLNETRRIEDINKAWDKAYSIIYQLRDQLLLVIDNVETTEDNDLLRLADLPCRLLITSRVEKISSIHSIHIDNLPLVTCKELFLSYYKKQPAPDYLLDEIIALVDRNTVTIELLAKTAQIEELDLNDFYQKLVELGLKMSIEKVAARHERLQKEDLIIEQLSKLFSAHWLKKTESDLLVLISVIPSLPFTFQQAKELFHQKNKEILSRLSNLGWINAIQKNGHVVYSIHSIIASAVRQQFNTSLYSRCSYLIQTFTELLWLKEDEHGSSKAGLIQFSWSINDILEDHLQNETDGDFLYAASHVYRDIGNYKQATRLLRHCVRIYRKIDESKQLKLIHAYNELGLVYYDISSFQLALTQYKKAKMYLAKMPWNPLDWIPLYTNIGTTYMAIEGTVPDGLAYRNLKSAYELAKQQYGEKGAETLDIRFKLANCLASTDHNKAQRIFKEVIQNEEIIYGSNHWRVAAKYFGYANFCYEYGDPKEAEDACQKALPVYIEQFGEKHPSTADVKNTLALIYDKTNHVAAYQYHKDYLDCAIATYGEINSITATAWSNIGIWYVDDNQEREAIDKFQRAIDIICQLRESYPDELGTYYCNQGECYIAIGDYNKASELYLQAKREYEKDVSLCQGELVSLYGKIAYACFCRSQEEQNSEEKEKAYQYYQLSENGIKTLLGQSHRSLALVYFNHAVLLLIDKKYDEALEKLSESKRILISAYGDSARDLVTVQEYIAEVHRQMRKQVK